MDGKNIYIYLNYLEITHHAFDNILLFCTSHILIKFSFILLLNKLKSECCSLLHKIKISVYNQE